MKVLDCSIIKEKAYIEELENALKVIIIPKKDTNKKYVIWGTNFGSIDNRFINPDTNEEVIVPDGVAHFLEHKMFEQPDGSNSLDTMMALGLDANAYTTNDHTAYLFECSDDESFYKGLDELMDYVQSPYYTDENVEKEKGIIGQEIMMYDDDPGFQLYLNTLKCLYSKNPIRIDIAGSIESISKINPDILYKCYNTFYNPANMVLVTSGNFEPNEILQEIKSRLKPSKNKGEIKRIFDNEPENINQKYMEKIMSISMPIFMIGIKDKHVDIFHYIRPGGRNREKQQRGNGKRNAHSYQPYPGFSESGLCPVYNASHNQVADSVKYFGHSDKNAGNSGIYKGYIGQIQHKERRHNTIDPCHTIVSDPVPDTFTPA